MVCVAPRPGTPPSESDSHLAGARASAINQEVLDLRSASSAVLTASAVNPASGTRHSPHVDRTPTSRKPATCLPSPRLLSEGRSPDGFTDHSCLNLHMPSKLHKHRSQIGFTRDDTCPRCARPCPRASSSWIARTAAYQVRAQADQHKPDYMNGHATPPVPSPQSGTACQTSSFKPGT